LKNRVAIAAERTDVEVGEVLQRDADQAGNRILHGFCEISSRSFGSGFLRFLLFLLGCLLIQFLIKVRIGQIRLLIRRTASQRAEQASRVSAFVILFDVAFGQLSSPREPLSNHQF
jgi:hypothetical protein